MAATVSLKSLIPDLAPAFNMTTAALYERQRALERAGLIKGEGGRGPGSGVRATPQAVAALLCSALATDSLSEVENEAVVLGRLRASEGSCPVTGERTFGKALSALLASPEMLAKTLVITVRRGEKSARIEFEGEESNSSVFGARAGPERLFRVEASLQGFPLVQIAKLMAEAMDGRYDPYPGYSAEEIEHILGDDIANLVRMYRGE